MTSIALLSRERRGGGNVSLSNKQRSKVVAACQTFTRSSCRPMSTSYKVLLSLPARFGFLPVRLRLMILQTDLLAKEQRSFMLNLICAKKDDLFDKFSARRVSNDIDQQPCLLFDLCEEASNHHPRANAAFELARIKCALGASSLFLLKLCSFALTTSTHCGVCLPPIRMCVSL